MSVYDSTDHHARIEPGPNGGHELKEYSGGEKVGVVGEFDTRDEARSFHRDRFDFPLIGYENDSGFLVAERSGWVIGSDEVMLGNTIEFPPALTSSPRGPETHAWHDDYEQYAEEEPDLAVEAIEQGPPQTPACCGFCSPESAIAERGVYEPDYRLVAPDGEAVVFTCHACIADAPVVE